MKNALARLTAATFLLLTAAAAHACTVCDSPTAHQVRAGIFNGHFTHTLVLVALPFPLFALAVAVLHFGLPDFTPQAPSPQ